ncbi:hypothetical protein Acr_18g0005080 [Actinidia rufa]|uniref:DUF7876 domain-containing protein n=1 Tax=Actinidia rufa TaxID=165716 RepID=A0A7J0G6D1_9ERIC|nr:hypothetical protein Acr_18g0005080 [Actinidia rufa]
MEEVLVIQHHRVLLSLRRAVTDLKPITYHTNRLLRNGWQCQLRESMSPDDEYRSSRNIAISLFRRYRNVVERGGGDNLKEFISAGVNAYALGCTDEGLRNELTNMKESGIEIEAMQSYGGSTSLRSKIFSEEPTLFDGHQHLPCRMKSRSSGKAFLFSHTFPSHIIVCPQDSGHLKYVFMSRLPVKTLQLEQMAVVGYAEEPSVVASRMRIVFSTLEVVSPQWPRV